MSERERSYLAYGLGALIVICATILGGLHVFSQEQVLLAFSMALGAVGLIHMPAPRATLLPFLMMALALSACHADTPSGNYNAYPLDPTTWIQKRPAAVSGSLDIASVPINADQINVTPQAPGGILCGTGKACLAASSASGRLLLIDTAGNQIAAGDARAFRNLTSAPGGNLPGDVYYDTTTNQYRYYTAGAWGPLPPGSGGTGTTTALSNNRIMCSVAGAIVECAALLNGQIPIGNTGNPPTFGVPTGANGLSFVTGAGTLQATQTFGSDGAHAAVGNDVRFPPTPTAAGKLVYDTGVAYAETAACAVNQLLLGQGAAVPICGTVPNAALTNSSVTLSCTGLSGCGSVALGGTLSPAVTYGTGSNTATQGNDVRLPPAPSAAGRWLYDTGTAWAAQTACPVGTVHYGQGASAPICSTTTWPNSATQGDLLVATAANVWASLPDVATGQLLASAGVGAVPAYTPTPTVTTLTGSTSILTALLDAAVAGVLNIGTTNATSIALKQNTTWPSGKTGVVGANTLWGAVSDKLNAAMLAIASQAAGDTIFADTTTTFARLAKGSNGQALTMVAGLPAWVTPSWWIDGVLNPSASFTATTSTNNYIGQGTNAASTTTQFAFVAYVPSFTPHVTKLVALFGANTLANGGTITVEVYDVTTSTVKSTVTINAASGSNGSAIDSTSYTVATGDALYIRIRGSATGSGGALVISGVHVEFGAI